MVICVAARSCVKDLEPTLEFCVKLFAENGVTTETQRSPALTE